MQTGQFTRGDQEFTSAASIVLGGNIEVDKKDGISTPSQRYSHWLAVLPAELNNDTAFIDRLHSYLPGWELTKIRREYFAQGYGFMTDYFAEILKRLREKNIQSLVSARIDFSGETSRNQDSVQKTISGLVKLIFPHKDVDSINRDEVEMCLDLAIEARQIVQNQMAIISPGEYQRRPIKAKMRD